ncbi:MAG: hypothetical protein LC798_09620 [Chloroflexi bacterium]|nr:hypothetical protein [Chloroflexota bacterium]
MQHLGREHQPRAVAEHLLLVVAWHQRCDRLQDVFDGTAVHVRDSGADVLDVRR